jgi:hypothetical protein
MAIVKFSSPLTHYSFSTKFELFINFIGLIAAAGAGAAQVRFPVFQRVASFTWLIPFI